MTNRPGGILTPSQRKFLRGINIEDKSNSAKSMTRSRIVERIQTSYIEDVPLIVSSLAADTGYNTLKPEKIVEVEDPEDLLQGLVFQVALVRELAIALDADPEEVIQDGLSQELLTEEDRIWRKARNNPKEITLSEVELLGEDIPQEIQNQIRDIAGKMGSDEPK